MVEHPEMTLELITEFFEFLQGKEVPNYTLIKKPKLTKSQAFTVIYYLQERLGIIPDNFEFCDACKQMFDKDHGGISVDIIKDAKERGYRVTSKDAGKTFCGGCR